MRFNFIRAIFRAFRFFLAKKCVHGQSVTRDASANSNKQLTSTITAQSINNGIKKHNKKRYSQPQCATSDPKNVKICATKYLAIDFLYFGISDLVFLKQNVKILLDFFMY